MHPLSETDQIKTNHQGICHKPQKFRKNRAMGGTRNPYGAFIFSNFIIFFTVFMVPSRLHRLG